MKRTPVLLTGRDAWMPTSKQVRYALPFAGIMVDHAAIAARSERKARKASPRASKTAAPSTLGPNGTNIAQPFPTISRRARLEALAGKLTPSQQDRLVAAILAGH